MIVDTLTRLGEYAVLNPRFAKAVAYLRNADLESLAEGRYEIDGDSVYMTVSQSALRDEKSAPLEAHDRYVDVQIVISGTERFGWAAREACRNPKGAYSADKDILFFSDRPTAFATLGSGQMVVFFPSDAHAPLIGEGSVRKCIVKIRK